MERLFGLCTVRIENAANSGIAQMNRRGRSTFSGIRIPGLSLANGQKLVAITTGIMHDRSLQSQRNGL